MIELLLEKFEKSLAKDYPDYTFYNRRNAGRRFYKKFCYM